jgi:RNA polymerase sigma-70 factor (ECF subfamily)
MSYSVSLWFTSFVVCTRLSVTNLMKSVFLFLRKISFFDKPDYTSLSDIQIIQKILDWQKDLFEVIVNRYSDKIFRYFYYQFGFKKDIATELVQEVFLKIWQKLSKFDPNKSFESWIFLIAHNLAVDWLKRNNLWNENTFLDNNLKNSVDFDLSSEVEYKRKLLENLLLRLDFKYREVLILYYFEWKSYDEIAEILGTTKNTVWSWIKRAKDKLKEIIEKDPILKQAIEI